MKSNDYHAMVNGSMQNLEASYEKRKGYFSAAVNFGFGYDFNVGSRSRVLIEPYLQVPLRGIGVGSMPVMTGGLHLGIMRKLHR